MTLFVGILDGGANNWGVRIPDLPGCHGAGESAEAAISDAICAAREWAAHRAAKGATLPAARGLDEISRDEGADFLPGEIAVMIPVPLESGRLYQPASAETHCSGYDRPE